VSIQFVEKEQRKPKDGYNLNIQQSTKHMNMAINVYEYGRGGKCVYTFKYTYKGIREIKMQMEKEDRHLSRIMRTSIGTVT